MGNSHQRRILPKFHDPRKDLQIVFTKKSSIGGQFDETYRGNEVEDFYIHKKTSHLKKVRD